MIGWPPLFVIVTSFILSFVSPRSPDCSCRLRHTQTHTHSDTHTRAPQPHRLTHIHTQTHTHRHALAPRQRRKFKQRASNKNLPASQHSTEDNNNTIGPCQPQQLLYSRLALPTFACWPTLDRKCSIIKQHPLPREKLPQQCRPDKNSPSFSCYRLLVRFDHLLRLTSEGGERGARMGKAAGWPCSEGHAQFETIAGGNDGPGAS